MKPWFVALSIFLAQNVVSAAEKPRLVRGPYLQSGSSTEMTIHFRTTTSAVGYVRFGTALGRLDTRVEGKTASTEHVLLLTGLQPATKYIYAIGTDKGHLTGGDLATAFITAPVPGTRSPVRILAMGDGGLPNSTSQSLRDRYLADAGGRHTDVWLMLGDNAYWSGTDDEYQGAVFDLFPNLLRRFVVWPTIGNHDISDGSVAKEFPYRAIFDLPTRGQAGGVASGTEHYYSFDHANIHFVCLDSLFDEHRAAPPLVPSDSPMYTWLNADLAANRQDWLVAFWHHPAYTKGTYDSDFSVSMPEMRRIWVPLLEKYGVDLVLTGHSHVYERSYLIDGHVGQTNTFTADMRKNAGTGRADEGGAYVKPARGPAANQGAVYITAGSGAIRQIPRYGMFHPVFVTALHRNGVVVIDVADDRMDAKFLRETGEIDDRFTIIKGAPAPLPNQPPIATLTPTGGVFDPTFGGVRATLKDPESVTLTVDATDPDGRIARVELWDGGEVLGTMTAPPWIYTWNNPIPKDTYPLGWPPVFFDHPIIARVFDDAGQSTVTAPIDVVIQTDNQPPVVAVSLDKSSYQSPATITIIATVSDPDGQVVKVEFTDTGRPIGTAVQAPFTLTLTDVGPGTYIFGARATDNRGQRTWAGEVGVNLPGPGPRVADAVEGTPPAPGPPAPHISDGGLPPPTPPANAGCGCDLGRQRPAASGLVLFLAGALLLCKPRRRPQSYVI